MLENLEPSIFVEGHLHEYSYLNKYMPFIMDYENILVYEKKKAEELDLDSFLKRCLPEDIMRYIYSFFEECPRHRLKLLENKYSRKVLINILQKIETRHLHTIIKSMFQKDVAFYYYRHCTARSIGIISSHSIKNVYEELDQCDLILTILEKLSKYKLTNYRKTYDAIEIKNDTRTAMKVAVIDYARVLYYCSRK